MPNISLSKILTTITITFTINRSKILFIFIIFKIYLTIQSKSMTMPS